MHPSLGQRLREGCRRLSGCVDEKSWIAIIAILAVLGAAAYFYNRLEPVAAEAKPRMFTVEAGEGFRDIAGHLAEENLIRSRLAFEVLSLFTGSATKLKPGVYELSPAMSSYEALSELVLGSHREVSVKIPEGASIYEIDKILSDAGVLKTGSIIGFNKSTKIEGRLFPDTYRFFLGSETKEVVDKFLENFRMKAQPVLSGDKNNGEANLILASLVEKEVPEDSDREIVAGILKKRLKAGMPLQVDATICYIKKFSARIPSQNCYPLTPLDFKIDSPYNTYLHRGLPPAPIGNPGISAINAVLRPKNTEYWYYLSDPKTKRTIFAKTLEEQSKNRETYLGT